MLEQPASLQILQNMTSFSFLFSEYNHGYLKTQDGFHFSLSFSKRKYLFFLVLIFVFDSLCDSSSDSSLISLPSISLISTIFALSKSLLLFLAGLTFFS